MSRDDIIRGLYRAFDRRDWDAISKVVSPDAYVRETPGFNPAASAYEGWEEVVGWFESWFKIWDRATNEVLWIRWATDSLAVVVVRVTVAGRSSGVETTDDFGHLIEFRGERVAGTTFFRTPEAALEAAGA